MSIYSHNLSTDAAVISEADIAAAHDRIHRAADALAPIPASALPDAARENLLWLAYHGYTVDVRQSADGAYLLWLPAAADLHITPESGIPPVWLDGHITPRDWLTYGARITAALLDAKLAAKEVR